MGWFSTDILGGDEPMDFEYDIQVACGYLKSDETNCITKENLEKNQLILLKKWKEENSSIIAFQTLGAHMVTQGAVFEKEVLDICISSLEKDEWAKTSFERNYNIQYLLNVIKNYKNTPTIYEDVKIVYGYDKTTLDDLKYIISLVKPTLPDYLIETKFCFIGAYEYGILITVDVDKAPNKFLDSAPQKYFDYTVVYTSK